MGYVGLSSLPSGHLDFFFSLQCWEQKPGPASAERVLTTELHPGREHLDLNCKQNCTVLYAVALLVPGWLCACSVWPW